MQQRLAMAPSGSKYYVEERVKFFNSRDKGTSKEETSEEKEVESKHDMMHTAISGEGQALVVLYGSNQGTSKELALTFCEDASDLGFTVSPVHQCPPKAFSHLITQLIR